MESNKENLIEKLHINVKDSVSEYAKSLCLNKIASDNDTIFYFYCESEKLIPSYVLKNIEETIEKDFLNNKAKCRIDVKYNIDFTNINSEIDKYDIVKDNFIDFINKDNKMLASIFSSAVKDIDRENNLLRLTIGKNMTIQSIVDAMKNYIIDILNNKYNIKINIVINESDDIRKERLEKKRKTDEQYFRAMQEELERYEKEKEEKANNASPANDTNKLNDDNTKKSSKIIKHKKKTAQVFYDDGTSQIFGKDIPDDSEIINFSSIGNDIENIYIKGVIFLIDYKENLKSKKNEGSTFHILNFYIVNNGSSIKASMFLNTDNDLYYAKKLINLGMEVVIRCDIKFNNFDKDIVVNPKAIKVVGRKNYIYDEKIGTLLLVTNRLDEELEKRVELHLHTKFSENDAVGDVSQYLETAKRFGMKSIAITDHGNVQALPIAEKYINDKIKKDPKFNDFKLILGCEGYLVDDNKYFYMDSEFKESNESFPINGRYYVLDVVTSKKSYKIAEVLKYEISLVEDNTILENKIIYIKPKNKISYDLKLKLGEKNLDEAKDFKEATIELIDFMTKSGAPFVLASYSINNTWRYIKEEALRLNDEVLNMYISKVNKLMDLYNISKAIIEGPSWHKVGEEHGRAFLCKNYGIDKYVNKFAKDTDAKKKAYMSNDISSRILISTINSLKDNEKYNIFDLKEINEKINITREYMKRTPYNHIILLAKNDIGRVNLYKLVSDGFTVYLGKKPLMPKSVIEKYREGIIVGSACVAGEVYTSLLEGKTDAELIDKAKFYDYLEIQPCTNNSFLLNNEKYDNLYTSIEDIEELNRKIIEIATRLEKLVIATSDSHYVNKEDKIFRQILKYSVWHKKGNLDENGKLKEIDTEEDSEAELYFRTTSEMLKEFLYLGEDKAFEVVVKNTNKISDMCEYISTVRPDKCPPSIESSDEKLKTTCLDNAHKIYGEKLPPIIEERLNKELHMIIDNGYSVMYMSAKLLIDDSVEHGYPVGSRGSVGSSLVATMTGISEVNPLPPHYVCDNCQHVEIDTEETNKYLNETGYDMPDKECPICGHIMRKDGANIPFETFLGVEGGEVKEPDIDLNFSDEYQSNAHATTKTLFGEDHTFKAGTVQTIKKETSYSYVRKYNDENDIRYRNADIEYEKMGITDCKRSTGQHPGGMVVVPRDEYIYTFTPINYPANKEAGGLTTHFEYHQIEKNLLKLDILGHNTPTILKKLKDLTGVDPLTVPFYEDEVLKLFEGLDSLNIESSDIHGEKTGCLSIPEFGTGATMKMVVEAKPKNVSDLIRISGLAHGTNVWKGNIRDVVVVDKIAKIEDCMCCRDDIMLYLGSKGIDKTIAFQIMEKVRKGKGLTHEWEEIMRDKGVPEWYINCCNKIEYMFPKAHATAYVVTALRIAYYKVHFPIEYYTVFFSVKSKYFDYDLMCGNLDHVRNSLDTIMKKRNERYGRSFGSDDNNDNFSDYDNDNNAFDNINENDDEENSVKTSNQEKEEEKTIRQLRICEECLARGIEFTNIDIYKAKPFDFTIVDGKIMPSLVTIDGLGEGKVTEFYKKAHEKPFESKEDLKKRGKLSDDLIKKLIDIGAIPELKERSGIQISDFL